MKILSLRNICALGLLVCLGGCGTPAATSGEMPHEIVQKNIPPIVRCAAEAVTRRRCTSSMIRRLFLSTRY